MELSNIIFYLLAFCLGFTLNKYFLFILKKKDFHFLSDNQFEKPQAFHQNSTPRLGGLTIYLTLIPVFFYLYYTKNIFQRIFNVDNPISANIIVTIQNLITIVDSGQPFFSK